MASLRRCLACTSLLLLVVAGVAMVRAQDDGFDLRLRKIFPCQEMDVQDSNVSLSRSDILAVQNNFTYCSGQVVNRTQYNGFRMHSWSEANGTHPVIFISRQDNDGTVSFSIPLSPEGYTMTFNNVNRTLCPTMIGDEPSTLPLFYIDVFTSSKEPLDYSVMIEPVDNFTLEAGNTYDTTISPSSPQTFYFKMPDGVDVVTVHVDSKDKRCVVVSVQNKTCPINDLLENARSKGIYQTMSTSSVLTVEAHQVKNREFLLVLIAANYTICHDTNPNNNGSDTFEQQLTITVKTLKPLSSFWRAFFLPVVVFFMIPYTFTFLIVFGCFPKLRCVPTWVCKRPLKKHLFKMPCTCVGWNSCCRCNRYKIVDEDDEGDERIRLFRGRNGVKSYQAIDEEEGAGQGDKFAPSGNGFDESGSIEISIKNEPDEDKMMVPRMNKKNYTQLHKRYSVYGWNAITVGIFYALPAFQLVLSEQRVLNFSGDQDQCYYNFKCARPLGVFSAFNNVFSNIGYVLLGFLFILVVILRQCSYRREREKKRLYIESHGLPQFFGIYYAMGIALILEGFMSSFYHICPNDANFQFDTAFMFIIGGLLLVKVFQKRHPDIHANAFIAFFSFAVIIVCTLVGIYFSRKDPLATRLPIFILILALIVAFFLSFYYFHEWKWSTLCSSLVKMLKSMMPRKNCKGPLHKIRFIKLWSAFIINALFVVVGLIMYQNLDIATAILAFFLINLLYFLIWYFLLKIWYKEPFTWLALLLPVLIALVWGAAFYFFMVVSVTDWSVTPAESREINKDCKLLDFFDNHDIWHFLSAFGMFFAFMFVLAIDDGVDDEVRSNLHIF